MIDMQPPRGAFDALLEPIRDQLQPPPPPPERSGGSGPQRIHIEIEITDRRTVKRDMGLAASDVGDIALQQVRTDPAQLVSQNCGSRAPPLPPTRTSCGCGTDGRATFTVTVTPPIRTTSWLQSSGRFDGFHALPASVSKTCLVRFDKNKYSVNASAVGRPVEIHAYADRVVARMGASSANIAAASAAARRSMIHAITCRYWPASLAHCATARRSGTGSCRRHWNACAGVLPAPMTAIGRWSPSWPPCRRADCRRSKRRVRRQRRKASTRPT